MILFSILIIFITLNFFNRLGGWPSENWYKIIWVDIEAIIFSYFLFFHLQIFNRKNLILEELAKLSFSIYLIQPVVLEIFNIKKWYVIFIGDPVLNALFNCVCIILPIVIFISYFTYNLIEKPFLNIKTQNYL